MPDDFDLKLKRDAREPAAILPQAPLLFVCVLEIAWQAVGDVFQVTNLQGRTK